MQPLSNDYFKRRAVELGLDRQEVLKRVQDWLEQSYPGRTRAVSLNQGVLKILTPSSAIAGDLRLRQEELKRLASALRIQIQISSIT